MLSTFFIFNPLRLLFFLCNVTVSVLFMLTAFHSMYHARIHILAYVLSPTGTDFRKFLILFHIFPRCYLISLQCKCLVEVEVKTNVRIAYVSSQIIYLLPYSMICKHSYLFTSLSVPV